MSGALDGELGCQALVGMTTPSAHGDATAQYSVDNHAMPERAFLEAVIAFLDQFIFRGADSDILAVRHALAEASATRKRLLRRLPPEASERAAFDAMHEFLVDEWERLGKPPPNRGSPPNLMFLIRWTSWGDRNIRGEDMTEDPAQWFDWLDALKSD